MYSGSLLHSGKWTIFEVLNLEKEFGFGIQNPKCPEDVYHVHQDIDGGQNSDQDLNSHSHHHLKHKRVVVNTVPLRAKPSKENEEQRKLHAEQTLKASNCPE